MMMMMRKKKRMRKVKVTLMMLRTILILTMKIMKEEIKGDLTLDQKVLKVLPSLK